MDARYKGMKPEKALKVAAKAFEDAIDTIHWVAARNAKDWRREEDEATITKSIDHSRTYFGVAMDNLRYALEAEVAENTRLRAAIGE
jgi:hypothetical protein